LVTFYKNEYKELHRIYRLPLDNSPNGKELWDRYFQRGMTNLPEMRLLRKQASVCRVKWKEIMPYEKKTTDNENADKQAVA
ncbi:MAG TPA: hypothetical protein VM260_03555, partial [Pirellula sp.]|nr:hypothetical protein [Pirellula sp.]